jgi:hypothetical protein
MCFSAGASFASGLLLSGIGVATSRKIKDPSQKLFASIPAFFAIQQFSEGIVWITIRNGGPDRLLAVSSYLFLLFALVIWPTVIPLSVLRMEDNIKKRKILKPFLFAGIAISLYYMACLLMFKVTPSVNGFHIQYINDFPRSLGLAAFAVYVLVTIAPLFLSGVRRMYLFGILIFISCLITAVFYKEYLTSVWCFFAAFISGIIYLIITYADVSESLTEIILKQGRKMLT